MRILFCATDTIAVPLLEALHASGSLVAVFTAPDAPGKRGRTLIPSPVKKRALELGAAVYTPQHLNRAERETVEALGADTLVSFCYGRIFGPRFLSMFKKTLNVHPSPLPRYRGCSPIFETVRNLDREGAVSVQEIAPGIDEGRIYASLPFPLDGTETASDVEDRVAHMVPSLVSSVLSSLDTAVPREQTGEPSWSTFIGKDDGRIVWTRSAAEIHALVRACSPWPRAWCLLGGEKLLVTAVSGSAFSPFEKSSETPGTVVALEKGRGLKVATGDGYLYISRVLPPARKEMDASSFVNGNRSVLGAVLE